MSEPDRALRLALLLARTGREGLSVESLQIHIGGSRSGLYHLLSRLAEAGWPVESIRNGQSVLYRLADGLQLQPPTEPRTRAHPMSKTVEEMARRGLSAADIASGTGLSLEQVNNRLWKLRHNGRLPKVNRRRLVEGSLSFRVRELLATGMTREQIAVAVETSVSTVHATISRLRRDGHLPPELHPLTDR